jgi:uncharacterized protein (TIGR02452 family)
VAVSAIKNPRLINNHLNDDDKELTKKKLELIFLIGIANKYDSLVLSAIGCGAFKNPPEDIVCIFNELLSKYKNFFKLITFATIPNSGMKGRYITNEQNNRACNYIFFKDNILS